MYAFGTYTNVPSEATAAFNAAKSYHGSKRLTRDISAPVQGTLE